MITINSNGSKWGGESPDTIEKLIEVLRNHPLDRSFERFGNFVSKDSKTGSVSLFGNFENLSHVFNITADTRQEVDAVIKAIRANQKRPDYLVQPVPPPLPRMRRPFVAKRGAGYRFAEINH